MTLTKKLIDPPNRRKFPLSRVPETLQIGIIDRIGSISCRINAYTSNRRIRCLLNETGLFPRILQSVRITYDMGSPVDGDGNFLCYDPEMGFQMERGGEMMMVEGGKLLISNQPHRPTRWRQFAFSVANLDKILKKVARLRELIVICALYQYKSYVMDFDVDRRDDPQHIAYFEINPITLFSRQSVLDRATIGCMPDLDVEAFLKHYGLETARFPVVSNPGRCGYNARIRRISDDRHWISFGMLLQDQEDFEPSLEAFFVTEEPLDTMMMKWENEELAVECFDRLVNLLDEMDFLSTCHPPDGYLERLPKFESYIAYGRYLKKFFYQHETIIEGQPVVCLLMCIVMDGLGERDRCMSGLHLSYHRKSDFDPTLNHYQTLHPPVPFRSFALSRK